MTGRMTVIARVSGRRTWTVDQKMAMLRDAFGSGGDVQAAMERHEVSSGQLYTWRKQARSGELRGVAAPVLVPLLVDPLPCPMPCPMPCFAAVELAEAEPLPPSLVIAEPASRIGISLPSGITLTVDSGVDADALTRVLLVVSR